MDRTQGANYVLEDGKRKFTDEVPGTTVDAKWMNDVQEEIATVIENIGGGVLSSSNNGQLLIAINKRMPIKNLATDYGNSLSTMVNEIGSDPALVLINGSTTPTANLTIPDNIVLRITKSGSIANSSSYTTIINTSSIMAGRYRIFGGAGISYGPKAALAFVEWHGAVGDDNLINDDYINQAIASMDNEGVLSFGAGIFKVSENDNNGDPSTVGVTVNRPMILKGNGTTIKSTDAAGDAFNPWALLINNPTIDTVNEPIIIDGFKFDTARHYVDDTNHVSFRNCHFTGMKRVGIWTNCKWGDFKDNNIYATAAVTGTHLFQMSSCDQMTVSGNTFNNKDTRASGVLPASIRIYNSLNCIIAGNTIKQPAWIAPGGGGNYSATCIDIYSTVLGRATYHTITGNVTENGETGIHLYQCDSNTVSGNTCLNHDEGHGIFLHSAHENTITGNTINSAGVAIGTAHQGISIQNSNRNTIGNNTIIDPPNVGIGLNSAQYNTINNNTITCVDRADETPIGISLSASQNGIVSNNIIFDLDIGIQVTATCNHMDINNNSITQLSNSCTTPIYFVNNAGADQWIGISIVGNNIMGSYTNGIYINMTGQSQGAHNLDISHNNLTEATIVDSKGIKLTNHNLVQDSSISFNRFGPNFLDLGYIIFCTVSGNNFNLIDSSPSDNKNGITLNIAAGNLFTNNYIQDRDVGILIPGGADNNSVHSNYFRACDEGVRISVAGATDNIVTGNSFHSCNTDITNLGTTSTVTPNYSK